MAGRTQCDEVVWCIAANVPTFQMMYMQLYDVLCIRMSAAALAGVIISLQNVLTNIVFVVHLTKLIVCLHRQRLAIQHRFEALRVKLCSFYNDFADRQPRADVLDGRNVLLNLDFNRRCQPAFMFAVYPVVKARRTVSGLAVASAPAILTTSREQVNNIVPWL